jgi:photosystem I P700 chlorophyll a apoprotein A1
MSKPLNSFQHFLFVISSSTISVSLASTWVLFVTRISSSLSKGPLSTSWIWSLHVDSHTLIFLTTFIRGTHLRKILLAGFAHLGLATCWLSGLCFSGAYLSNFTFWVLSPALLAPCSNAIFSLFGQDILHSLDFRGSYISSAIYQVWLCSGIISSTSLKVVACSLVGLTCIAVVASFFCMHKLHSRVLDQSIGLASITFPQILALTGIGSLLWGVHCGVFSSRVLELLNAQVSPSIISSSLQLINHSFVSFPQQIYFRSPFLCHIFPHQFLSSLLPAIIYFWVPFL